jgi:hypothetical protein
MIPSFDHNGVIPPYLGNPANGSNFVSPYPTDSLELCQRFATSKDRIAILKKFMAFREEMRNFGISGFQYLDGSFLEDIENLPLRGLSFLIQSYKSKLLALVKQKSQSFD